MDKEEGEYSRRDRGGENGGQKPSLEVPRGDHFRQNTRMICLILFPEGECTTWGKEKGKTHANNKRAPGRKCLFGPPAKKGPAMESASPRKKRLKRGDRPGEKSLPPGRGKERTRQVRISHLHRRKGKEENKGDENRKKKRFSHGNSEGPIAEQPSIQGKKSWGSKSV